MATARRRRRPAGRGSVYPDGDRWIAQLRFDGGRKVRRIASSAEEAEVLLDTLREQHGLGVTPTRQTVQEFLEQWLESNERRWKPSTLRDRRSKLRLYVYPLIGRVQLERLTPSHVQAVLDEVVRSGRSPRTAHHTRAVLRSALTRAERWGLVTRNVAALTDPPHVGRSERQALNGAQTVIFLSAVYGHRYEAAYVLAVALGLRQGEVLGLRWQDVDLEARELHVRRSLQRVGGEYVLLDPKTRNSTRPIPLPDFVHRTLVRHRRRQVDERERAGDIWSDEWGLVFTTPKGRPVHGSSVTHQLHTVLASAGELLPDIDFHGLRHCATSLLLAEGVPPRVVMQILGHSTLQMTMELYGHVSGDALRDAIDRLDSWWGES